MMICVCEQDGLTPLHCASRSGHSAVVQMLINHEAQLTSKTKNGLSPLHMAAQGDHVDCAALLLHHGAPIDDVTVVSISSRLTCSSSSSSSSSMMLCSSNSDRHFCYPSPRVGGHAG